MFVWAHRGASAVAPENTMAAFREAEAAGAEGIELDIHLSRDGTAVVIHDETVDRTTDGRGAVSRSTVQELRRLDAGGWFSPRFSGEVIPTLEEVLEWAAGRMRLNLEIKSSRAGMAALEMLRAFPQSRVLVSSFDHDLLQSLRQADHSLPLAFLTDSRFWRRSLKRAAACGAESLHPRQDRVTAGMVSSCHGEGLKLSPWTVDDPRRLEELRRLGVDGVFTNRPRETVRVLRPGNPC